MQRRSFLADVGLGFTGLALGAMLHRDGVVRAAEGKHVLPDGKPHFAPKAKRVIWLFLAGLLPKTLNQSPSGRITREFLARYGANDSIARSLWCRFCSRSYCGLESDHNRRLRDDARSWLIGEDDGYVIRWIENYIESLTHDIQRAEIDEERSPY